MAITAEAKRVLGYRGPCLIVGDVALRKARLFLQARPMILVVASETIRASATFVKTHAISRALCEFATSDVEANRVTVSTIGDAVVTTVGRHSYVFCAKQST